MGKTMYDPATLIKEYTKKIKGDYPGLTDDQISEICKYQFLLTRREIESGSLRTVRIKYFGSYQVFQSRAIGILNKVKRMHSLGKANDSTLEYVSDIVENFLQQEKQQDSEEEFGEDQEDKEEDDNDYLQT